MAPVEALALNYLSYGFLTAVNNIWAWVAVITAAVGLWRMKASSSPRKVAALASSPEKMAAAAVEEVTVETSASTTTSFSVSEGKDLKVLDGSVVRLWDGRRRRRDAACLVADGGLIW
ncbi:hypothetical protein DH2020_014695 [Rehmannia glutinosa]|uniref:Uncharacterized protein n=1 Tax=Rehmannia glutinosa TaxID=99300 RepID=A0ABR0WXW4_REHGL